ncbi:MAG: hypothetical protein J6V14_07010 [Clostridia bacterium]|nr:hypothetical protein [Clostridia bacterium]
MSVILTGLAGGNLLGSYLLVGAALVLLVLYFVANKFVQKKLGAGIESALTYTCSRGLLSALLMFAAYLVINRRLPEIRPYSLIMAALLAACVCAYMMLGFKIMALGSLSVFTVFLMLGGMIVPYLYGVIFLDEAINAPRIIGIVLMVVSMFFPLIGDLRSARAAAGDNAAPAGTDALANSSDSSKTRRRVLFCVFCLLVFLLNGFVSVISKTHAAGVLDYPASDSLTFVVLTSLGCGVISGVALLIVRLAKRGKSRAAGDNAGNVDSAANADNANKSFFATLRPVILFVVLAAIFDGCSFFFQQLGAAALPASVMYPLMTGGSIVLTALAGFLIFKEKPTRIALIGLAITFAATFLFLF